MLAPAAAVKYNGQPMVTPEILYGVALTALPILLSLVVHEFAHARTALAFGDPTAKAMGRCTLNPLAHLDPIGTILMVLTGVGWARPVPVDSRNLQPRRLGNIAVSAAGAASNVSIALACTIGLRVLAAAGVAVDPQGDFTAADVLFFLLTYLLVINLNLAVFNLIPLFPLDGHHIGREALPAHRQGAYMRWQILYGRWLFLALWIGPELLRRTAGFDFNPLGWYLGGVVWPSSQFLLGEQAMPPALMAFLKFQPYLYWLR